MDIIRRFERIYINSDELNQRELGLLMGIIYSLKYRKR